MNDEQENVVRYIFKHIRSLRKDLDDLYTRKTKLEHISNELYTAYLDELWGKCNVQLLEIYDTITKKYNALYSLQTLLIKARLGEKIILESIKLDEPRT
jgi:hypothetical protein